MDAAFYESLPGAGMYVWRFLDTKFEGLPMTEPVTELKRRER